MPSPTITAARERARPLLGTIVRIRVSDEDGADAAIDAAFATIAHVHARMSFQEPTSDLAAIAAAKAGDLVPVDADTVACLRLALDWAERSGGVFDPVAAAGAAACWRDLAIEARGVRVARPLRVDLSGIAKGYAVDLAAAFFDTAAVIEAGGDLRVIGAAEEEVALRPSHDAEPAIIALADGALAASDPALARGQEGRTCHWDARGRHRAPDHFVAVAAPRCADADALTKIVLALGADAASLLRSVGATAYRHDRRRWSMFGAAA